MKQLVYRVEHPKDRIGPYRHDHVNPFYNELQRLMALEHTNESDFGAGNHPGGWLDFNEDDFLVEGNVFGFHSLESLTDWFDKWLSYLFEMGYVVRSYTVPNEHITYGKSNLQIMFNQDYAEFDWEVLL